VTHDQTEALTFADRVIVMNEGIVVQAGTPVDLFERPQHTFVGHFIGSPGMNLLPATFDGGVARFAGHVVQTAVVPGAVPAGAQLQIGVRPEFVTFAGTGIPVHIEKVADAGRFRVVETRHEQFSIRLLVGEDMPLPSEHVCLRFDPSFTYLYADGWRQGGEPG
jgi:glycerol transport system ATP-binding protein